MTKILVLVTSWKTLPTNYAQLPAGRTLDSLAKDAFASGSGWSVVDFWEQATHGFVKATCTFVTIPPIPFVLAGSAVQPIPPIDRQTQISAALQVAQLSSVSLLGYDGYVVWINPPSGGGALTGVHKAVLDYGYGPGFWGHTFLCHEFGHVLGFEHPVAMAGGKLEAYGDPNCMMSAMTCFSVLPAPGTTGGPPATGFATPTTGALDSWWSNVGPLPSAAIIARYVPAFASSTRVVNATGWDITPTTHVVTSHSKPSSTGTLLVEAPTKAGTHFVEVRTRDAWDSGLVQGVHVHRRGWVPVEPWEPEPIEFLGVVGLAPGDTLILPQADLAVSTIKWDPVAGAATVRLSRTAEAPSLNVDVAAAATKIETLRSGTTPVLHHPCAMGEYGYELTGTSWEFVLAANTTGLTAPVTFKWGVGAKSPAPTVVNSGPRTLAVQTAIGVPGGPPKAGNSADVVITRLGPDRLSIATDAADGNYQITVSVRVEDANHIVRTWESTAQVDGFRVTYEQKYWADLVECLRDKLEIRLPFPSLPHIPGPGPDPTPWLEPQLRRERRELFAWLQALPVEQARLVRPALAMYLNVAQSTLDAGEQQILGAGEASRTRQVP